jgi:hypothetical protein
MTNRKKLCYRYPTHPPFRRSHSIRGRGDPHEFGEPRRFRRRLRSRNGGLFARKTGLSVPLLRNLRLRLPPLIHISDRGVVL